MDKDTRVPDLLQWFDGMLLTPQHFQQNDIYWHVLLRHQMAQLQPHYWGLLDFKIDETAVRGGKVQITALHAVMPDGLVVQYPASDQADNLSLDVSAEPALRADKPLKVHLVVPVRADGAASSASSIQRYDSVKGEIEQDENTGDGNVEVCRLRPRLSLLCGDKVPAKYVSLTLLEVRRNLGGHFDLTEYHPPLLRLSASRFVGDNALQTRLEALGAQIRAKARELIGVTDNAPARPIANAYHQQVVSKLVTALPAFEVLVRSGVAHPFEVYVALGHIVGHMAGVGADPMPLLLDAYRHDDAAPAFFKALRYLTSLLAKLNAAYEVAAFEHVREDLFSLMLAANAGVDRIVIELKPQPGQTPQALAQWLSQACIGTAAAIPLLRQRRLPGARVRPLPPEQVTAMGLPGGVLFEVVNQTIEHDNKSVAVMQPGSALHIQGASSLTVPAMIVLYTPNRINKRPAAPARAVA
ncbi:MAG: type VI secretion system baseplate subunit TssK [Gammaproteobacteria bacterium]|nr:type VI secretion system baseplate subunit TssK [Gammaproteobacteria bacterium]